MRWERVQVVARARETPEGKKSAGRTGGIWGPGKRWGHSCNSVKGGRYVYVFGGYGGDTCQTNDVHVFDTVKQTWSKPMMKGDPPSPRDSHSCTTVGKKLFVFGGTDGTNPLNDLHILDTSTNTWMSPILHENGPAAREGHSAALVDKRLFIFGGCGKSGNSHEEVYYNDLYILDTETLVWECAVTSGIPPVPRDSHTCSSWKNKLIVLGGEDASDCYLSDVHMLDADTLTWRQITTSGQMLAPRAGHTTVALGSSLFVFGGFTDARNLYDDLHVLNVETGKWNRVTNINRGPSARFSGAGDCLDDKRGILVFLGGCNKSLEALDDMFYLYTVNNWISQPKQELLLGKELKISYIDSKLEKSSGTLLTSGPSGVSQPLQLYEEHGQAGTKTSGSNSDEEIIFEAKVTGAHQHGYAIETIINGKLLRGMLFSCSSLSAEDSLTCMNKRLRGEADSKLNSSLQICSTATDIPQEIKPDPTNIDGALRKEAPVQQLLKNPDSNLANTTTEDGTNREHMVCGKSEPVSARNEASDASCKENVEIPCLTSTEKDAVTSLSAHGIVDGSSVNGQYNKAVEEQNI